MMQWIGNSAGYLLPAIAVLALAVGFFASSTYDSGSTVYLRQYAPPGPVQYGIPAVPSHGPVSDKASARCALRNVCSNELHCPFYEVCVGFVCRPGTADDTASLLVPQLAPTTKERGAHSSRI